MTPTIQEVKTQHADRLLSLPGVISVGVGRRPDGTEVIVVGLDRSRPEAKAKVPQTLGGYPVRIEIVGEVKAQD
jgi:hypothetical protein